MPTAKRSSKRKPEITLAEAAINPPKGAEVYYQGSFYKISAINKVFIFVNGEWMLSSRSVEEIKRVIEAEGKMAFLH